MRQVQNSHKDKKKKKNQSERERETCDKCTLATSKPVEHELKSKLCNRNRPLCVYCIVFRRFYFHGAFIRII